MTRSRPVVAYWVIGSLVGVLLVAGIARAEDPATIGPPEGADPAAEAAERAPDADQPRAVERTIIEEDARRLDAVRLLRLERAGVAIRALEDLAVGLPVQGGVSISEDHPQFARLRDLGLLSRGPKRSWGCEQATGEPDTMGAGDITTAWASAGQDDQDEWLEATYAATVKIAEIHVVETYNPGSLFKVTMQTDGDMEVVLWKGEDPTPKGVADGRGTSIVKPAMGIKTNRIRIHLASKDVPGWNEIDAIGIKDSEGKMHWATHVAASSNYAGGPDPGWTIDPKAAIDRMLKLEKEVDDLKRELEKIKAAKP
jgi:hypothetical protein